jgi:hypothetical protein
MALCVLDPSTMCKDTCKYYDHFYFDCSLKELDYFDRPEKDSRFHKTYWEQEDELNELPDIPG